MTATLYFLIAIASANLPLLNTLASFPDKASCETAASAIAETLKSASDQAHLVCMSSDSLDQLGKANGLK